MKTLKKTLCLVLAMVMVFGLCAVSASAKLEYTDNDDITYAEAVDVLSGIGILAGDARGFRPTADITRAEAAKIMAYIMVGNAAQADALKASSDPFADVPASHWAAGYIAYCNAAGIIVGKGDGYHPNDNVKGLEFATMLLRALGYGKQNEYVGADWSIYASRDAIRLGIFEGNLGGASLEKATREECALYAFNAITKVNKVTYSELLGGYITGTSVNSLGTTTADANMGATFAKDFDLEKKGSDPDDFGCPTGHHWVKGKDTITADYGSDSYLKASYTAAVKDSDVLSKLGKSFVKDVDVYEVIIDGEDKTSENAQTVIEENNKVDLAYTGNGVQTYIYSGDNAKGALGDDYNEDDTWMRIIVINTYLTKVDTVVEATSKKDAYVEVADDDGVTNDATYPTEEFEEGDYVLITVADGKIKSMVKAPIVEEEITRFNKKGTDISIVAGGKTYVPAEQATDVGTALTKADSTNLTKEIVNGDTYKLYVDEYGYLFATEKIKDSVSYVYVAQMGVVTDTSGKLSNKDSLKADIYKADGTNEIMTVYTGADQKDGKDCKFKVTDGDLSSLKSELDSDGGAHNGVYKFYDKDGKAFLVADDETDVTADTYNVTKGVYDADGTNRYDGKTVFFYVSGTYDDDLSVTVYTGINSVPVSDPKGWDKNKTPNDTSDDLPEALLVDAFIDSENNKIKAAEVASNFDNGDGDTVYFYLGSDADSTYSKVGKNVFYDVYTAGAKTSSDLELGYGSNSKADTAIGAATKAGFYVVNTNNNHLKAVVDEDSAAAKKEGKLYYAIVIADSDSDEISLYDGTDKYALYDVNIIDLRGDDVVIKTAKKLAEAIDDSTVSKVAISYADNASKTIADLYILPVAD